MGKDVKTPTVLIAKSDKLLNDLLCEFVKNKGFSIIDKVYNGNDALKLLQDKLPDILITGMELRGINGINLLARIFEEKIATRVIIFSKNKSELLIKTAKQFNVSGYLFFDDGVDELNKCINNVLVDKVYFSLQVQKVLDGQHFSFDNKCLLTKENLQRLTSAEIRILYYLAQHMSMKQIAEKLFISPHTVNNHLANIRQKLNILGRRVLLKYALSIWG